MAFCGTCEGTCADCIGRPGGCPSYLVGLRDTLKDNEQGLAAYHLFVAAAAGPLNASGVLQPLGLALIASDAFLVAVKEDCNAFAAVRQTAAVVRDHCILTGIVGNVVGPLLMPFIGPYGAIFNAAGLANFALADCANEVARGRPPSPAQLVALAISLELLANSGQPGPIGAALGDPETRAAVEQGVASDDAARRALENPGGTVNPRQVVANGVMQRCGNRGVLSLFLTQPVSSHIVERTLFKKAWERAGAPADCAECSRILRELWGDSVVAPAPPSGGGNGGGGVFDRNPPRREAPFPNAPRPPSSGGGGFAAIAAGALVGFFVAGPPGGVVGGVAAAFFARPKASSSGGGAVVLPLPKSPAPPLRRDADPGDRMDWVNRTP